MASLGLEKVHTQSTRAHLVYEELREAILDGRLKPGQRIVASQVAEELGVSRMPVREALTRLEMEGFVAITPYKEAVVRPLSRQDIEEIYAIRRVLEVYAVQLACERISPAQLAGLEANVAESEELVDSGDEAGFADLNSDFHTRIFEASGNERLALLCTSLWEQCKYYRTVGTSLKGNLQQSLEDHRQLVKAIRMRDSTTAAAIIIEHTNRPLEALRRYLDKLDRQRGEQ